ncbi:hypothetical protein B0H10DRAFT_2241313 [Mycena sp. CBHHK59/15]|nr:hypothetical protein B0H10DRAFT_2241313 [Mycena sp. CBHHK59/15]
MFSPIGIYDLCRRIGVFAHDPRIFPKYKDRFLTSDIVWFVAGASNDGKHIPEPNSFFPKFDVLRNSVPIGQVGNDVQKVLRENIRWLAFDVVTCWDRLLGGSTMILHIDGTTTPGTPSLPEFLCTHIYLPPSFLSNNPGSHGAIAQITQSFIEAVGQPTVTKWRTNVNHQGWSLTQNGPPVRPNSMSPTLIPRPQSSGSAYYIFNGRPAGALDVLLRPAPRVVYIEDDDDITMPREACLAPVTRKQRHNGCVIA